MFFGKNIDFFKTKESFYFNLLAILNYKKISWITWRFCVTYFYLKTILGDYTSILWDKLNVMVQTEIMRDKRKRNYSCLLKYVYAVKNWFTTVSIHDLINTYFCIYLLIFFRQKYNFNKHDKDSLRYSWIHD